MIELILLKLLLKQDLFTKYFHYIKLEFYKNNNKEIYRLFLCLKSLQEKELKDYSVQDLIVQLNLSYPFLKPDDFSFYQTVFQKIEQTEVDDSLAVDYLEQQRKQAKAEQIALCAVDVAQGRKSWDELLSSFESEEQVVEEKESDFLNLSIKEVYSEDSDNVGLRWRLDTLNKVFGSLRKGNFGFVFARPEVGKTTFLASEVTYMAAQSNRPVVWFNNEEGGKDVLRRIFQAALGVTNTEIDENQNKYEEAYQSLLKDKILFVDDAGINKKKIERICSETQPGLIIFDQVDKIYGFEAERYDLKMKTIYQWARELAKKYGPVIAICQAGGTADGKKYLTMNDVDSSHTAKQGEADFILGIGATNADGEEYTRYLHASKNKLRGDKDSIPQLRHGKLSVRILPEIARYEDIMKW